MKIILNEVVLGELNWEGMGELSANVPTTAINDKYLMVAYNAYDFGDAMMLWQDMEYGGIYILDTAEITKEERKAGVTSPQLGDSMREYYKRLMEAGQF